eukprot:5653420-Alexandrium_andersonii.AAC.1
MGAAVSLKKSLNHATEKCVRRALAVRGWPGMGGKIPVLGSSRDLGSHRVVSGALSGSTLTKRAKSLLVGIRRVERLPLVAKRKLRVAKAKYQVAGLYGAAAARVAKS